MATNHSPEQHLRDLLGKQKNAILVTHGTGGDIHARPMAIAEFEEDILYFATAIDSPKVADLQADSRAHVLIQDGARFISLAGTVRVLRDPGLVDRLWSESWKLWFPEGKSDPHLCVLSFAGGEGEYWDERGPNAVKFLVTALKAYATGISPAHDETEHGRATLRPSN